MEWKVGFVGYSGKKFDVEEGKKIVANIMKDIDSKRNGRNVVIVSGYTALGIPLLVYEEAVKYQFKTVGFACPKANEYPRFAVDEFHIIGNDWGDESKDFLAYCDTLYKIGGGPQSEKEFAAFEREKFEFKL